MSFIASVGVAAANAVAAPWVATYHAVKTGAEKVDEWTGAKASRENQQKLLSQQTAQAGLKTAQDQMTIDTQKAADNRKKQIETELDLAQRSTVGREETAGTKSRVSPVSMNVTALGADYTGKKRTLLGA